MANIVQDRSEDLQRNEMRQRQARNGKKIAMILLSVFFLVVLTLVALDLGAHHRDLARLANEGKVVSVQVTARSEILGRYYMEYEFDAGGQRIDGMESVSEDVYQNTPSAGFLRATYIPADPSLRQLGTVPQANVTADLRTMIGGLSALLLCSACALWLVWRCYPEPQESSPHEIVNEPCP